jgi:flagella basal body P-ring formation protein FlgA
MNAPITTLAFFLTLGRPGLSPGRYAAAPRTPGVAALPVALITFRPTVEVSGRVIRLADVAVVEGADPRLVARLEAVDVGAAPLHGHTRSVSAAYAQVRIRQIGVDISRLRFHGPEMVSVSRPEQIITGSALQKMVCAAVEAANPDAKVEVTSFPADLRVPVGAVELKPEGVGPVTGSTGSVVLHVLVAGAEEARVPIGFRVGRLAPVLVAARDLPAGQVLTEADMRVEQRAAAVGPIGLSDVSQAVGQQVAVPLRAGVALTANLIRPAVLVKRGERIRLVCRGPGFIATAIGEALQDGAAGQVIHLRNVASLRELTGVVTSEEMVEVPF